MHYYFTAVSLVAGICLGFGVLYLFIGLRRKHNKPLNLTFAVFALCYATTLFNGVRWYSTSSVADFVQITRWDAIFVVGAFVSLVWYVSLYTGVRPRIFLWILSATIVVLGFLNLILPNMVYGEILGLTSITLPWGESLTNLDATGSILFDLLLLAQLVTLGFIIFALVRQFLKGQRQPAVILGLGMLPFIVAIFYEILGESGVVPYIPFGEFGFLGIAIAASLQMANSVIKTEEALEQHRLNLEKMVDVRTSELEAVQEQLLIQAKEQAVTAERNRLARDLHDVVTQILFSINLIAISLPRLWKRNPDIAERSTNELQRLTRGALAEMRTLLRELRPHTIIVTDLGTLLTQLCDGIAARHDIPVDVNISPVCDLPPEVHVAMYRIAQETMNNIAKHAEASYLALNLVCDELAISLSIADDGQGFDVSSVSQEHMGLNIMQERAAAVGANLAIESQPGMGTTIEVSWPLSQIIGDSNA